MIAPCASQHYFNPRRPESKHHAPSCAALAGALAVAPADVGALLAAPWETGTPMAAGPHDLGRGPLPADELAARGNLPPRFRLTWPFMRAADVGNAAVAGPRGGRDQQTCRVGFSPRGTAPRIRQTRLQQDPAEGVMNRFKTEAIIMACALPAIFLFSWLVCLLWPLLRRLLAPGD